MSAKPVIPRDRVSQDVDDALSFYVSHSAAQAALGVIDALEAALDHIARYPASGLVRFASELSLPGLRTWRVRGYPHLVFYVEHDTHIDVWRVLHGERDVPAWMRESGS